MTRKTRSDCRVGTFEKSMDYRRERLEMMMDGIRVVIKRLERFGRKEARSEHERKRLQLLGRNS